MFNQNFVFADNNSSGGGGARGGGRGGFDRGGRGGDRGRGRGLCVQLFFSMATNNVYVHMSFNSCYDMFVVQLRIACVYV